MESNGKEVTRWTMPPCYAGATWESWMMAGFGQSRQSDALEESNFATALERLGGETETVRVVRESHWAFGWVEWSATHEADIVAVAVAEGLCRKYDAYPALDEDDWSQREDEEAQRAWREWYTDRERVAYIREHSDQFDFSDMEDLMGCARGRYFAGWASELIA